MAKKVPTTIYIPPEVLGAAKATAEQERRTLSAWMTIAAQEKLAKSGGVPTRLTPALVEHIARAAPYLLDPDVVNPTARKRATEFGQGTAVKRP
jgi:hypothetical protein